MTTTIRFLKSTFTGSTHHAPGETLETDTETALRLIHHGNAELVDPDHARAHSLLRTFRPHPGDRDADAKIFRELVGHVAPTS